MYMFNVFAFVYNLPTIKSKTKNLKLKSLSASSIFGD